MSQTARPSLEKIDPTEAWQPWQPSAAQPWDRKWAAHLYRRAAFGATTVDLDKAVQDGFETTLNRVLDGDPRRAERDRQLRASMKGPVTKGNKAANLRGWWLYWMMNNAHPLREKMTLFWHNHFATSIVKVQSAALMFTQNQTLYDHALGKFQPLLLAMSKDPAMLIWLDSNSNVKGKPNENYAREVMELFSLGVGNYTEKDVQEAARAFTGWHTDNEQFTFAASVHDFSDKTVLGQKGNWDGGDIVRIVLEQPAAARFLVHKLYRYFISESQTPPDRFLQPLTDSFGQSGYDIAALVRTMLSSRHFFSAYAYRQRIKSPVEFVLGAARDVGQGQVAPGALITPLEEMGQQLFAPPNVKGWNMGRHWLNTATLLARHNFVHGMTVGSPFINYLDEGSRFAVAVDPAAIVRQAKLKQPAQIAELMFDLVLQGDVRPDTRQQVLAFLNEGQPKNDQLDDRIRETFHLIMTMPEYQLA
ncbi:MAG: DUF1800 domain-containing protein [Gemmataceae bacterium]